MNDSNTMRRTPKQARSLHRVKHILDTAEQLFSKSGYDSVSTNAIAAQADISIGSLYQFFPSKESIFSALVQRYSAELNTVLIDPAELHLPLGELVGQMIDRLAQFDRTHLGFKMMLSTLEHNNLVHGEIVARLDELLARRFQTFNAGRRHQSAVIMVSIVKGLMPLSGVPEDMTEDQMLVEVKTAVLAYLQAVLKRENIAEE